MSQQTKELRRIIAHLEKIVKVLEELERKEPDPRQGTLIEIFNEEEKKTEVKIFNVMGVYI